MRKNKHAFNTSCCNMQPNISVDTNCDEIQVYTFNRKNLQYRRNYFRPSLNSFFCRGNSQKEVKYISKLFKMIALLCLVCAHLCLNSKNGNTEMKMKLLPETRKLCQNKAGDPLNMTWQSQHQEYKSERLEKSDWSVHSTVAIFLPTHKTLPFAILHGVCYQTTPLSL